MEEKSYYKKAQKETKPLDDEDIDEDTKVVTKVGNPDDDSEMEYNIQNEKKGEEIIVGSTF